MPEPSIVSELGPVIDDLRGLNTEFGIRPYRIFLVRTKWDGGQRGVGIESVLTKVEILPRPLVVDLASLDRRSAPVGLQETGDVLMREISFTAFKEDDLMGRVSADGQPAVDEDFFYGIEEDTDVHTNTLQVSGRRFYPERATYLDTGKGLEWSVSLKRQDVSGIPDVWQ